MIKSNPIITVDIHENTSGLLQELLDRGLDAVEAHLITGDWIVEYKGKTCGGENKRGADFDKSTKEGRLKDQLCRLYDCFDFPVLIIEAWKPWVGDDDEYESIFEKKRKHDMGVRTLNRRICTYDTESQFETVNIIEEIVRDMRNGKLFTMKRPVLVDKEMSKQMKFICGLDHVKHTIGERILDDYGSPMEALVNVDDWGKIDGIGKKKLEDIKKILNGWD